jgi:hypothetical protein
MAAALSRRKFSLLRSSPLRLAFTRKLPLSEPILRIIFMAPENALWRKKFLPVGKWIFHDNNGCRLGDGCRTDGGAASAHPDSTPG